MTPLMLNLAKNAQFRKMTLKNLKIGKLSVTLVTLSYDKIYSEVKLI